MTEWAKAVIAARQNKARPRLGWGAVIATMAGSLLPVRAALAAGADSPSELWTKWQLSPLALGLCLLALAVYLAGFIRRWRSGGRPGVLRAIAYIGAVALAYFALQGPFDWLSDQLFWVDRAQHVLLHDCIPILLALSAPVPELIRGLPRRLRHPDWPPVLRSAMRRLWSWTQHPVVGPFLFIGVIYAWLAPAALDYASTAGLGSAVMNASVLIGGMPFWWLMLDPAPGRVKYGHRIVILWLIMLPQMLIGFYIMFTSRVLYPTYASLDKGWMSSYLIDQHLGGMVVWMPTIMISALAAVIVLRFWMRQDRRSSLSGRAAASPG